MTKNIIYISFIALLICACSKDQNEILDITNNGIPPELQRFSPSEGRDGTYVVIEGNNFSTSPDKNIVYFNGTPAKIHEVNDSVLIAIVPQNATTGKIVVSVDTQADTTSRDFKITDNPWLSKDGLAGRNKAIAFSIGDYGYCGLGYTVSTCLPDMWKYDPFYNNWTKLNDFKGIVRKNAIAFSLNNKAYVGLGLDPEKYDATANLADLWEYNPSNDSWTQIDDFPGGGRHNSIAFTCNNQAYIGLGYSSEGGSKKDFWTYNPANNKWTQLADYPGGASERNVGFVIGNNIYIGCGRTGVTYNDFWKYNTETNSWTQIADFAGGIRVDAVGFGLNGYGYVGTGSKDTYTDGYKDFWKYDPIADSWTQVTDFYGGYVASISREDGRRAEAIAFTIGDYAYVGTGRGYMHTKGDIWEYKPE